VTAAEPIACQVDGDFLGMRDEMVFTAVPAALAVVAPPRNNLVELRK
jgi:diacylglycerol kinase family enzyme